MGGGGGGGRKSALIRHAESLWWQRKRLNLPGNWIYPTWTYPVLFHKEKERFWPGNDERLNLSSTWTYPTWTCQAWTAYNMWPRDSQQRSLFNWSRVELYCGQRGLRWEICTVWVPTCISKSHALVLWIYMPLPNPSPEQKNGDKNVQRLLIDIWAALWTEGHTSRELSVSMERNTGPCPLNLQNDSSWPK